MIEILKQIDEMADVDTLTNIINVARDRKNYLLASNTRSWSVGDKVKLQKEHQGRKPYDAEGKIVKINLKNIKIDFGVFGRWNVPKTMLQKVG